MNTVIIFSAVTLMVCVCSALPLLQRRRSWLPADEPDRATEALEAEKRSYLRAIRDIDFEHAAGKINARDHAELRDHYTSEAARIIGQIEKITSGTVPGKQQAVLPARSAGNGKAAVSDPAGSPDPATGIAVLREKLEQLEIDWEMGEIRNDAYFALRDAYRRELDLLAGTLQDNRSGHGCSD